jgi:hypothetical protein
MENNDKTPATLESVWEAFREAERLRRESEAKFEREMAESRKRSAESEAKLEREMAASRRDRAESEAKFDREMAESRKRSAESEAKLDRKMAATNDMIGGLGNSNGMFAEEFFFNTIEKGNKEFFGEHFTECYFSTKRYNKANQAKSENDIMLVNGEAVAIVEVKYKAHKEDVEKIIEKLPNFRILYPGYRSYRTYLGLAAFSFEKGVETHAVNNGIAVMKQVGDRMIVNEKNLKVF